MKPRLIATLAFVLFVALIAAVIFVSIPFAVPAGIAALALAAVSSPSRVQPDARRVSRYLSGLSARSPPAAA